MRVTTRPPVARRRPKRAPPAGRSDIGETPELDRSIASEHEGPLFLPGGPCPGGALARATAVA